MSESNPVIAMKNNISRQSPFYWRKSVSLRSIPVLNSSLLDSKILKNIVLEIKERKFIPDTNNKQTFTTINISIGAVGGSNTKIITKQYIRKMSDENNYRLEHVYPEFFNNNQDILNDTVSVDSEGSNNKYSQDPENVNIIPKIFSSNSILGQNSRNDVVKATNIIYNLQSNSHISNSFFHSFSEEMKNMIIRHLTADSDGRQVLSGLNDNSFKNGEVPTNMPRDFFPNFDGPNWKKNIGPPHEPNRNQFSFIEGAYQRHPKRIDKGGDDMEVSSNTALLAIAAAIASGKIDQAKERESKSKHCLFARECIGESSICVIVDENKSIIDHLKFIRDNMSEDLYMSLTEDPNPPNSSSQKELYFELQLENGGHLQYAKDLANQTLLKDIVNNSNIKLPIKFQIKIRDKHIIKNHNSFF
jgi:hypothetical protein